MNEAFVVFVKQIVAGVGVQSIRFVFNRLADALEFVSTCIECGDGGTEVRITREESED